MGVEESKSLCCKLPRGLLSTLKKNKVGPMPDISSMNKDDLAALCTQLYEQSCSVFGEKWQMEQLVKKRDAEIQNLETECSESHGTFKVPKLKKVNKFKKSDEDE